MDSLKEEIAAHAADVAVERHGRHLPQTKQLALWKRYRDSVLEALMAFEAVSRARAIRAKVFICDN